MFSAKKKKQHLIVLDVKYVWNRIFQRRKAVGVLELIKEQIDGRIIKPFENEERRQACVSTVEDQSAAIVNVFVLSAGLKTRREMKEGEMALTDRRENCMGCVTYAERKLYLARQCVRNTMILW